MSWNRLKRTVAPTSTPVTIGDLRLWLRLDVTDEDVLIDELIQNAVDYIEGPDGIGVALMTQTWELSLDCFPEVIEIPLGPVQTVDSVSYVDGDGNTQTVSNYQSDTVSTPARVLPAWGESWPSTRRVANAVTVEFTAGYTTVPSDIKRAIALLVGHWESQRVAATPEEMTAIPFGVDAILDKYRAGRFG